MFMNLNGLRLVPPLANVHLVFHSIIFNETLSCVSPEVMGVPCWVDVKLNSSLIISFEKLCSRLLNRDVGVGSSQPQPIDDIADVRAAPWDDSAPWSLDSRSRTPCH